MLSENLKKIRKEKGITQKKLAELSNVRQSTISTIERGQMPKTGTLEKIAKALGVKVSELWNDV